MNNIIEIHGLSKDYGKFTVLDNINLELTSGKIVGLCGPNGAGKTTMIKILTGLLRTYKGDVKIGGNDIGEKSKALVSYLPDINYFNDNMTGEGARKLYKDMYYDFDERVFFKLFEDMKLDLNQPLKKMSKGMKEKFQLALCLSRQAEVYLLDEPIAGVDPASRDLIIDTILTNYSKDALMVISTHLIQDIENVLDEVIFINDGKILLHKDCDELREERGMTVNEIFREEFRW